MWAAGNGTSPQISMVVRRIVSDLRRHAVAGELPGLSCAVHADDRERIDAAVRRGQHERSRSHSNIGSSDPMAISECSTPRDVPRSTRPASRSGTGIGHDITERKQAEEERAQLIQEQAKLREAEETNRAKDAVPGHLVARAANAPQRRARLGAHPARINERSSATRGPSRRSIATY